MLPGETLFSKCGVLEHIDLLYMIQVYYMRLVAQISTFLHSIWHFVYVQEMRRKALTKLEILMGNK